jgi:glycosyltransferase involved in cell wall biosynthesis
MHINIFDSGLNGRTGHHFDFCLSIGKRLALRGHSVGVWGGRDAEPGLSEVFTSAGCSFAPLFSHIPIALNEGQVPTFGQIEAIATQSAAQLCGSAVPAGLNFFPTLKPTEFLAYSHAEPAGRMVSMVHTLPGIHSTYSSKIWATACANAARRGLHARLGVLEPLLADFLRTYSDQLLIELAPFPLDGAGRPGDAVRPALRPQCIGFFGNQRDERGLDVIAPLAQRLLADGYRVVVHDTRGQFNTDGANPKLRVLSGFIPDLAAAMAQCDVIVCPVRWENYALRPSGIVAMSMACGIPCIVASGTLSAATYHRHGSMVCYQELGVDGIMQAIERLAADYPRIAGCAREAAQFWRATHGIDRAIDWMLAPESRHENANR